MKGQKKEEVKPIEVEEEEEWEVEKILNKRRVRGIDKYLVQWKGFMAEHDTWEREEELRNARELVDKFERRLSTEVRRQEEVGKKEGILRVEKFKRMELLGKYMARLLYGWDDGKFKTEYLRTLEKNWCR